MLQANFPAKIVYGENSLEFLSTLKVKRVVIFADEIFHKFNPDVFAAIDSIFDTMGAQQVFQKNDAETWVCTSCGHEHYGNQAPQTCPVCGKAQAYFAVKVESR